MLVHSSAETQPYLQKDWIFYFSFLVFFSVCRRDGKAIHNTTTLDNQNFNKKTVFPCKTYAVMFGRFLLYLYKKKGFKTVIKITSQQKKVVSCFSRW